MASSRKRPVRPKTNDAGEPLVRVNLDIPLSSYEKYVEEVTDDKSVEEVINDRINSAATHSDVEGIWIDKESRVELQRHLGVPVGDSDDLRKAVAKIVTLSLMDCHVTVRAELLVRLKSRAIGVPLGDYVATIVRKALEQETGLY